MVLSHAAPAWHYSRLLCSHQPSLVSGHACSLAATDCTARGEKRCEEGKCRITPLSPDLLRMLAREPYCQCQLTTSTLSRHSPISSARSGCMKATHLSTRWSAIYQTARCS